MKFAPRLFFMLFLWWPGMVLAQITGTITNPSGEPLPHVNIYPEGSFSGTTSNENGYYELALPGPGEVTVVFQYLGYQTVKKQVSPTSFPFHLDVVLAEKLTSLEEVVVSSGENPANQIMRNAIEKRQFHRQKIRAYTADFYSRGLWRIQNAPEKILGQEVGDFGGGLDTTRSGIIYLSETISEITYRAPDDFKEKILASKVSGQDNGFSLNSAREATISFYANSVDLNSEIISPLADHAFVYYRFSLEGVFYNDRGELVNKIRVLPRRPRDPVFTGAVYIVEDSWQVYGIELKTSGEAMQVPAIEELAFNQNFNYSKDEEIWVPISQTVDFVFDMFGIAGSGRFTAVYTNYDFDPEFDQRAFTNEVLSFEPRANEKDSLFWQLERPVPLTREEADDYLRKDSIQERRNSRPYMDSVDQSRNRFRIPDLLMGYTYRNSYEQWALRVGSPLLHSQVNTVQGYHSSLDISFRQSQGEMRERYWRVFSNINYGFSDDRFRVSGGFEKKFNNFSKPVLSISGGITTRQINDRNPISETINGIATQFFERNYLKLYELVFIRAAYKEEFFNGFEAAASLSIENRAPLFNTWNNPWVDRDDAEFTSNNPLQPNNKTSVPFEEHQLYRFRFSGDIRFDQKYLSFPNGKYNVPNSDYPRLTFAYEKGFGAKSAAYGFDHLQAGMTQILNLGNKGELAYHVQGGTFFGNERVTLVDKQHFNGNQTRIGMSSRYLDKFNLLPYYRMSTHRNYTEAHVEYNFQNWVLGKIPLVNLLNYNLVLGAHQLSMQDRSPYSEVSIGLDNLGFGKFRFMRLDYVISSYQGHREGGFVFGLKFLNVID